ncbi:MAG: PQQ-dependent sugar dehydrogenase [Phycisphaerales bacterium JB064]
MLRTTRFVPALAVLSLTLSACGQATEGPAPIYSDSQEDSPRASGYRVETVIEGLQHPWGMAWLPDGSMIITERGGRALFVDGEQFDKDSPFVVTPSEVDNAPQSSQLGQGGMMDVALHPNFESNHLVYFTHATGDARANRTVLSRGKLVNDDGAQPFKTVRLENVEEIFRVTPDKPGGQHFGSRLLWLPDGTLLMSTGDGGNPPTRAGGRLTRENPQYLDNALGKILRMTDDGGVPDDNPFADREDIGRYIYTYGHRNVQGMAIDPGTGHVWATEHGARGGDELNRITAGTNYGWPVATYSIHYNGNEISDKVTLPDMADPVCVWTPVLAASGLAFYTGDKFPQWQGDLFAGGLVSRQVRRVMIDETNGEEPVEGNETLPFDSPPLSARIRDVRQGPDGYLYLLTDARDGRLLRLVPDPGQ